MKIIIILLFVILLTSCDEKDSIEIYPKGIKVTHAYIYEDIESPYEIIDGYNFFVNDEIIYCICDEFVDKENYIYKQVLYSFDTEINFIERSELPVSDKDDRYLYYNIDANGDVVYIINSHNFEQFIYYKYSSSGELITEYNLSNINNIYSIKIDSNGNIFIATRNNIIVLSDDFKKLCEINIPGVVNALLIDTNENVLVKYLDLFNDSTKINYIDINKKELGESIRIPEVFNSSNYYELYFGDGYDIYIKDTVGLYGYNYDDVEAVMLINWNNSDIVSDSIAISVIVAPDKIICISHDYMTNKNNLVKLIKIPDEEIKEKYIITLAAINEPSHNLQLAILNFNRNNGVYRIIVDDYSKSGQETLNNKIITDDIPDIIFSFDYEEIKIYSEKGLFINLYNMIDNDADISRNDLFECVKKPYEINNNLYTLGTQFNIFTLAGNAERFDNEGWTFGEFIQFDNKLPEDAITMQYMNRMYMFGTFYITGIDHFIDYTNAVCDFENKEFISTLNYLYSLPERADSSLYSSHEIEYESFLNGNILLRDFCMYGLEDFVGLKYLLDTDKVIFKGWPAKTFNGTTINIKDNFGITNNSLVKDGAWEFIKYLLSTEYQETILFNIPATIGGFNYQAEYVKNNANHDELSSFYKYSKKRNLTDGDVNYIFDFLNSLTQTYFYDQDIYNMVYEDVQAYLNDQKSAEEVAKIIQNRISIYLNENYK